MKKYEVLKSAKLMGINYVLVKVPFGPADNQYFTQWLSEKQQPIAWATELALLNRDEHFDTVEVNGHLYVKYVGDLDPNGTWYNFATGVEVTDVKQVRYLENTIENRLIAEVSSL